MNKQRREVLKQMKEFSGLNIIAWVIHLVLVFLFVDLMGVPAWLYVIVYSPITFSVKFYIYRKRIFNVKSRK